MESPRQHPGGGCNGDNVIEGKGDKGKGKGKGKSEKGKGKGKKGDRYEKEKERPSGKEVPFLERAKEDGIKTKALGNQKERAILLVTVFVKFQKLHKFSNFLKYQYEVANQVLELRQSVESLHFPLPLCQQELHVSPGRGAMLSILFHRPLT